MPSVVIGNPVASGGVQIIGQSGQPWPFSGMAATPVGGIQLRFISLLPGSGLCFIGFSGNVSINSGGFQLSGGANSGMNDGMPLRDGDSFFVPRMACGNSGNLSIFAIGDASASGGRLYWQAY